MERQRMTFALYLDLSLDLLLPGFFDNILQYGFAQCIERSALRVRMEVGRLEIEGLLPDQEANARQVVERAAEPIAENFAKRLGAENSREFGRITVHKVENAPQPKSSYGAGENPAVRCPQCGDPMIVRDGLRGLFHGCRNYPRCRGSRRISE